MSGSWPRARDASGARARLRVEPEDFQVEELLGFTPAGEGEHLFLRVRKRNLASADVAGRIARWAAVAPVAVGFSGRKDRQALTTQWFSVQLPGRADPALDELTDSRLEVLEARRHDRKLRRGVHRGNAFRLRLRELQLGDGGREALARRLADLHRRGVPNYFAEQRFGAGAGNLEQARAWRDGRRRPGGRDRRGMLLSTLRANAFNVLLAQRVSAGSWETVGEGDVCQLDGTRSVFPHAGEPDLADRAARGDLHLALPLPGRGERLEAAAARAAQDEALAPLAADLAHLEAQGLELAYRAARAIPGDFAWDFCEDDGLQLAFTLATGSYATAVVAELLTYLHKEQAGS